MVSTEKDENLNQDEQYNSDDEISDFGVKESVETHDNHELNGEHWNNEMDEERCLNDLKKGEELSTSQIIYSRLRGDQSIFLEENNQGNKINEQEHAQGSQNLNQDS
jgi:hypothetical protein